MPDREHLNQVAQEWVGKAENDLLAAAHTLKLGAKCPVDIVCFHAQQCVEKYLKAYLVQEGAAFPRTHDIEELVALLPGGALAGLALKVQRRLTAYAVVSRYPGPPAEISLAEARAAVKAAGKVRKAILVLMRKHPK